MGTLSTAQIVLFVLLAGSFAAAVRAAMRPRPTNAVSLDERTMRYLRAIVEEAVERHRTDPKELEAALGNIVSQKVAEALPKPAEPEPAEQPAAAETPQPAAAGGQVPYRVHLGGQVFDLMVNAGENLLHAALDRNVELDFSCLEGNCDSCQVKVLKGREFLSPITSQERDMIDEEDLKAGERLACMVTIVGGGPIEVQQG